MSGLEVLRFAAKVRLAGRGCWIWVAARFQETGYGAFRAGGRTQGAHRVAYKHWRGRITPGLVLDHVVCDIRECVNPWHVEPVTDRANILRGQSPGAIATRTDRCRRGHSMADAKVQNGRRACRECIRQGDRRRRAER